MFTVVGVMAPDFQYPTTGLDAWIPATLEPGELTREAINNYRLVGRLDPRMSLDQARREAAAFATRLGNLYGIGARRAASASIRCSRMRSARCAPC